MSKKEKIIAICFIFSYILLVASCIFTIYSNKPKDQCFVIENVIEKIVKNLTL